MNRNPLILCVDGDRTSLMIRKAVLETAQYDVLTAVDVPTALSITRFVDIDLLMTEQTLPSRTGVELARECKRMRPQMRVMLLTDSPFYPAPFCVDEQFCALEGPVALLNAVDQMLARRPVRSVRVMAAAAVA